MRWLLGAALVALATSLSPVAVADPLNVDPGFPNGPCTGDWNEVAPGTWIKCKDGVDPTCEAKELGAFDEIRYTVESWTITKMVQGKKITWSTKAVVKFEIKNDAGTWQPLRGTIGGFDPNNGKNCSAGATDMNGRVELSFSGALDSIEGSITHSKDGELRVGSFQVDKPN